jgi:hypothetical protein
MGSRLFLRLKRGGEQVVTIELADHVAGASSETIERTLGAESDFVSAIQAGDELELCCVTGECSMSSVTVQNFEATVNFA